MMEILLILLLIFANGVFSAAEIAVVSMRTSRTAELLEKKRSGASAVAWLQRHAEKFFATVQIGITVVSSLASVYGGSVFVEGLGSFLTPYVGQAPARGIAFAAVVVCIAFTSLILGELVPKSLALRYSSQIALLAAPPICFLARVLSPFVWFLTATSNLILKPFGDRTDFRESHISIEEVRATITEAAEKGTLSKEESEVFERLLHLQKLRVGDLIVPRSDIVSLPFTASHSECINILREHKHTRIPVHTGSIDQVAGILNMKEYALKVIEGENFLLQELLRPAFFVPETKPAQALMREMQKDGTYMALVVDENGMLIGIVTLEDLVEEIVGEICEEYREPDPSTSERLLEGLKVHASMKIHHFNFRFGSKLPEGSLYSTIAGLLLDIAGRVPKAGEHFYIAGFRFTVLSRNARKVTEVEIRSSPESVETERATS